MHPTDAPRADHLARSSPTFDIGAGPEWDPTGTGLRAPGRRKPSAARIVVFVTILSTVFSVALWRFIDGYVSDSTAGTRLVAEQLAAALPQGWDVAEAQFPSAAGLAGMGGYFGQVESAEVAAVTYYTDKGSDRTRQDDSTETEALVFMETEVGPALLRLYVRRAGWFMTGPHTLFTVSEVGPDFVRLDLDEARIEQISAGVAARGGLHPFGRGLQAVGAGPEPSEGIPGLTDGSAAADAPPGAPGPAPAVTAHDLVLEVAVPGVPADTGIRFTAVDLEICVDAAGTAVRPHDVALVDSAPGHYLPAGLDQPAPQLGEVGPGACGRGWVTFGTLRAGTPLRIEVLGAAVDVAALAG